ncbi:MAG: ATP-dependent DNA helicase [Candidatus Woesearchaeota archaeon]
MIWFPFEKLRQGQQEMINVIEKSLLENKPIMIHAPTGIGKTAAVLSIVLPFAKQNNKKVFFLTSRLLHHHLIKETISKIIEKYNVKIKSSYLIGKKYLCSFDFALQKNDFHDFCAKLKSKNECQYYNLTLTKGRLNLEILDQLKDYPVIDSQKIYDLFKDNYCAYEIVVQLAKEADIVVLDYNYILNDSIRNILFKRLNLSVEDCIFIFDEAHNLPKRATEILSAKVTMHQLKNAIAQMKEYNYDISDLKFFYEFLEEKYKDLMLKNIILYNQKFTNKSLVDFQQELKKKSFQEIKQMFERILMEEIEILNELTFSKEEIAKNKDYFDFIYAKLSGIGYDLIEKVKKNYVLSLAKNLELFLYLDDDYFTYFSFSRDSQNYGLFAECLNPGILFKDLGNNLIFMSGTLKPLEMYNKILLNGIANELELKSPFPEKNKLEFIFSDVSTKFKKRNEDEFNKISSKLNDFLSIIPGNVLIFFPSYHLLYILKRKLVTNKAILYEKPNISKVEKDELLDEFKGYSKKLSGAVLLAVSAGNFSEGIDLPGDYLNAVIVVGFPLEKPDLKTKARIDYYEKKFKKGEEFAYIYPTIAKVMQNAGRCIRTETDRGVIIYLDERYKRYHKIFSNALIDAENYKELILNFFKN